jgi:uncharacterized protein YndB with AHSA1/START domain
MKHLWHDTARNREAAEILMTRTRFLIPLLAALSGCATVDHKPGGDHNMETSPIAFTLPSDTEIAVERTFDAPRQRVWDTWTSCDHLPNWMLGPPGWTMPICQIDLRPGGTQRIGWRGPDGAEMEIRGTFTEVDPPGRLIVRESWGGDWPETTNTLILTEVRGKTRMVLTIRYPSREARDAALQTGMKDGMTHSFDGAAAYLAKQR